MEGEWGPKEEPKKEGGEETGHPGNQFPLQRSGHPPKMGVDLKIQGGAIRKKRGHQELTMHFWAGRTDMKKGFLIRGKHRAKRKLFFWRGRLTVFGSHRSAAADWALEVKGEGQEKKIKGGALWGRLSKAWTRGRKNRIGSVGGAEKRHASKGGFPLPSSFLPFQKFYPRRTFRRYLSQEKLIWEEKRKLGG